MCVSLVTQSHPTLCNPMDCRTPGFPVLSQLPELAQAHVHWDGDTIQSSHPVVPVSPCLQTFPASGYFLMSQFFAFNGQSIGDSVSVFSVNIQDWFPLEWLIWSPCCPRDSQESSSIQKSKTSIFKCSAVFMVQLLHAYMTTRKTIDLTRWTFVGKIMSVFFNVPSRFVIALLPRIWFGHTWMV